MTTEPNLAVSTQNPAQLAQFNHANPIGAMLNSLFAKANTPEMLNAATATVEKMLDAYNKQEDRQAVKEFSAALAELQADIPTLIARKEVRTKDGQLKYKSKPLPEMLHEIKPIISRHGFSIYTDTRWDNDRGVAILELIHKGGHSRRTEFAVVRSPTNIHNPSETDEGAMTRAIRRGVCAALNIAVAQEDLDDARSDGGLISPADAADLRRLVSATASDESAFLRYAGASSYETIRQGRLGVLRAALARKKTAVAEPVEGEELPPAPATPVAGESEPTMFNPPPGDPDNDPLA